MASYKFRRELSDGVNGGSFYESTRRQEIGYVMVSEIRRVVLGNHFKASRISEVILRVPPAQSSRWVIAS